MGTQMAANLWYSCCSQPVFPLRNLDLGFYIRFSGGKSMWIKIKIFLKKRIVTSFALTLNLPKLKYGWLPSRSFVCSFSLWDLSLREHLFFYSGSLIDQKRGKSYSFVIVSFSKLKATVLKKWWWWCVYIYLYTKQLDLPIGNSCPHTCKETSVSRWWTLILNQLTLSTPKPAKMIEKA